MSENDNDNEPLLANKDGTNSSQSGMKNKKQKYWIMGISGFTLLMIIAYAMINKDNPTDMKVEESGEPHTFKATRWRGDLDLSLINSEDFKHKCVSVRVRGHEEETFSIEEAILIIQQKQKESTTQLRVGLVFLENENGFLGYGRGTFHLYHFLEFMVVAFEQLERLSDTNSSKVHVPWIYVPLLHIREVCGVADGINCLIADLLLQGKLSSAPENTTSPVHYNTTWYGMESNPTTLKDYHPAFHGQHKRRKWNETLYPLNKVQNIEVMKQTADIVLIISLRHGDRCSSHEINKPFVDYVDTFPSQRWHENLMDQLKSVPLTRFDELTTVPLKKLIVGYVDRQSTRRKMPQEEHDWLVGYLDSHPSIDFWHLFMGNYSSVEQLRITSSCDILVGVHGNGLSHMLWMQPRKSLIEIFWLGYGSKSYQYDYSIFAQVMRHKYLGLMDGEVVDHEMVSSRNSSLMKIFKREDRNTDYNETEWRRRTLNGRSAIERFLNEAIKSELGTRKL